MRSLLSVLTAVLLVMSLGACNHSGTESFFSNTPAVAACADGQDNDGDGLTDFPADPGCTSASDSNETDPPPPPVCSDGLDNDGDGKIDFPADPGCTSGFDGDETDPVTPPACSDGLDN